MVNCLDIAALHIRANLGRCPDEPFSAIRLTFPSFTCRRPLDSQNLGACPHIDQRAITHTGTSINPVQYGAHQVAGSCSYEVSKGLGSPDIRYHKFLRPDTSGYDAQLVRFKTAMCT